MPLQNRVAPDGSLHAVDARGLMMGNRGGKIHDPRSKTLLKKRWASKRWICCLTKFKSYHREVMGNSYTELFFTDEVIALAAGHRPCAFCRRSDFTAFQSAWQAAHPHGSRPTADQMDAQLHLERQPVREATHWTCDWQDLPDGVVVQYQGHWHATFHNHLLYFTFDGYTQKTPKPTLGVASVITPKSCVEVLRCNFKPQWHMSAKLLATNRL